MNIVLKNVRNCVDPRAVLPDGGDTIADRTKSVCEESRTPSQTLKFEVKFLQGFAIGMLLGCCAFLSGCATSSSKPQVQPISFTDSNGVAQTTMTSLTAGSGTYLDVALSNDTQTLGVDWSVSCGSALAPGTPLPVGTTVDDSCGTFTPVHTLSGPVPSYANGSAGYVTYYAAPSAPPTGGAVTLYARATSDPSRYSTITLPIVGLPETIGFSPAPPSSLAVKGTTSLKAVLTNDYTAGGVNWTITCPSADCGSLSSAKTASGVATTYTAPSAVPAGNTVAVFATSATDPTKAVAANITILPVAIGVTPAQLAVQVNATGVLTATVANDVANGGVDWTLSCGNSQACGSITPHTTSGSAATYSAPASVLSGTVTVTATSSSSKTTFTTATITVTASQAAIRDGGRHKQFVSGTSTLFDTGGNNGSAPTLSAQLLPRRKESFR